MDVENPVQQLYVKYDRPLQPFTIRVIVANGSNFLYGVSMSAIINIIARVGTYVKPGQKGKARMPTASLTRPRLPNPQNQGKRIGQTQHTGRIWLHSPSLAQSKI